MTVRVLITGCSGFAGMHLAEHLSETTTWHLYGSCRTRDLPAGLGRIKALRADLRSKMDVAELLAAARPDLIFHLAGQAFVPEAWSDPWTTFEANVRGQMELLAEVARTYKGTRVVAVTSNEVYGAAASERSPSTEGSPLRPLNPYATSKVAQDMHALQAALSEGLDVVRVRPFNHFGPGQDSRFVAANFARQVAEAEAGAKEPVLAVGDLDARRDFTDVRDVVEGYRLAAERGVRAEVYNLGSGTARAMGEIAEYYLSQARIPMRLWPDPARIRPSDVPLTLCDATKARRELGWAPRISFEATLDDILDEWRVRTRPVHA